jgi:hypothetical protein
LAVGLVSWGGQLTVLMEKLLPFYQWNATSKQKSLLAQAILGFMQLPCLIFLSALSLDAVLSLQ